MAFQGDSIFWVEVEKIVPNPFQPRREFDEAKLKELSESVRMYGILQPLTVTRREVQNEDGSFRSEYELIAGERRLRASKLAGLAQVPVIIREGEQSEQEKLELAIIENLQREDLNAVDRALAFRQLADVFGLSHTQVAQKVGRSREYVSNTIRLLALPDYMLSSLRTGDMSEGHARTLLMLNDRPEEQDTVFREILLKKLSVREVERIARGIASEKIRKKGDYDADLVEMEKKFTETLGTRVSIVKTEFGGRLSIDYFTVEDLMGMLERMKAEAGGKKSTALGAPVPHDLSQFLEPREIANPRADELMALTNSTGLEMVEDISSHTEVAETVSIEPVHVEEAPVVAVMPEPVPDIPVMVQREPEVVVPVHNPIPSPVSETPAPVAEVAPISTPVQSTPVSAQPVRSSLRDQLASLLGQSAKPATPSEIPLPPPVPVFVHTATPTAPVVTPAPTPTPSEPDEADLYNLKDFSI
jgi:ParB family chromosome partitioning protein